MNEAIRVGEWIPRKMYDDAATTAIIGLDGVYYGVGPDQTRKVFAVYRFVDDAVRMKLGRRRVLNGLLYDIVAWGRVEDTARIKTVAERIDELFSNFANDQWKNWNFSSQIENVIDTTEKDDANKTTWRRIGGTYRISAFDLTVGVG